MTMSGGLLIDDDDDDGDELVMITIIILNLFKFQSTCIFKTLPTGLEG